MCITRVYTLSVVHDKLALIFSHVTHYVYCEHICICIAMYLLRMSFLILYLRTGVPAITYVSKSTTSFESEEVKLVCKATNYFDTDILQIKFIWYDPNGMQMINQNGSTTYNGSGVKQYEITTVNAVDGQVESMLQFNMVNHTDSGEYICRAFNDHQFYVEAKIKLIVECRTIQHVHTYVPTP